MALKVVVDEADDAKFALGPMKDILDNHDRGCCSCKNHPLTGRILSIPPVVALAISPYKLEHGLVYQQDHCLY
jgi:hypothetical protein